MANSFAFLRERLTNGASLIGTFVKVPSLEVVEISAAVGFDLVVIDLEHSQLDERQGRLLIQHGAAMGFPVIARIPDIDPPLINRLLEAGAAGIQLSDVESRADTQA